MCVKRHATGSWILHRGPEKYQRQRIVRTLFLIVLNIEELFILPSILGYLCWAVIAHPRFVCRLNNEV